MHWILRHERLIFESTIELKSHSIENLRKFQILTFKPGKERRRKKNNDQHSNTVGVNIIPSVAKVESILHYLNVKVEVLLRVCVCVMCQLDQ